MPPPAITTGALICCVADGNAARSRRRCPHCCDSKTNPPSMRGSVLGVSPIIAALARKLRRVHRFLSTDYTDYTDSRTLQVRRFRNLCNLCNLWIEIPWYLTAHATAHSKESLPHEATLCPDPGVRPDPWPVGRNRAETRTRAGRGQTGVRHDH